MTKLVPMIRAGWSGMATAALVAAVAFWAPAVSAEPPTHGHVADEQLTVPLAAEHGNHGEPSSHGDHGEPSPEWSAEEALDYSQAALGRSLGPHQLLDQDGAPLAMQDLLGQPLVISLIYTSCYHTCPIITQTLKRVVEIADEAFGPGQYRVLTLGFDSPRDVPVRMRSFVKQHGISRPGWQAASADEATIRALTEELGFIFFASSKGFDHLAQTTVVDASGKVYRQVYGETFEPPALVEPLKELIYGVPAREAGVSGWVAGIKLFCTVYDPKAGRYRFDLTPFISIFFAVTILGALLFIGWRSLSTWRRERRRP